MGYKKLIVVVIIILILLSGGISGYLVYDKILNEKSYNEINSKTNGNDNNIGLNREITDVKIIKQLEEEINSYQFFIYPNELIKALYPEWTQLKSAGNDIVKKENDIYYFTDNFMISQAIGHLLNNDKNESKYKSYYDEYGHSTNIDIPYEDVDKYLKNHFNITEYSYENFDAFPYQLAESHYSFDKNKNAYIKSIGATGGMFNDLIKSFNVIPQRFEEENQNYVVYAKIIIVFQDGPEYFFMDSRIATVAIYDNLEFNNAKFSGDVEVIGDYEDMESVSKDLKKSINYDKIQEEAPIYKFIYTKDKMTLDRIELVK